ncbi:hypothetical protein [uncultured Endozoicomonas sp.]|uniref:hypothetical protein n=1 Tax=uncultured Endozoicomonas sp. TaxID=432652 RepID=UPI00262F21D6|nr:hypothetical protein [uncultured Endozoicomonas sp.]
MKGVNHVQAFKAQYINQQSTEGTATNPKKLNFTSIKAIKIKAIIKKAGGIFSSNSR